MKLFAKYCYFEKKSPVKGKGSLHVHGTCASFRHLHTLVSVSLYSIENRLYTYYSCFGVVGFGTFQLTTKTTPTCEQHTHHWGMWLVWILDLLKADKNTFTFLPRKNKFFNYLSK